MLRFREEHMLAGVARRLKRGIDDRMNPGEVFSRVQDHVIGAARAHVERLVLEAFVDKVARGSRTATSKVALDLLCDLHALSVDRGRPGLVHGARPAHRRRAPRRSRARSTRLCRKVRPLAVELVDAFGVPPEMLRSPDLVG